MDKKDFDILKAKYQQAIDDGATEFKLYGQTMLVAYAKYLIEYEESRR